MATVKEKPNKGVSRNIVHPYVSSKTPLRKIRRGPPIQDSLSYPKFPEATATSTTSTCSTDISKFSFSEHLSAEEKLVDVVRRVSTVSGSVSQLGGDLMKSMFSSNRMIGVLLNTWTYTGSVRPKVCYMREVLDILHTVAVLPIKLRIELMVSLGGSIMSPMQGTHLLRGGTNASVMGHVNVFGSSLISIPISTLSKKSKALVIAMCFSRHDSFSLVHSDTITNCINYTGYKFDKEVEKSFNRQDILDRMIHILLRSDVGMFWEAKTTLLSVFSWFPPKDLMMVHTSYLKLEALTLDDHLAQVRAECEEECIDSAEHAAKEESSSNGKFIDINTVD